MSLRRRRAWSIVMAVAAGVLLLVATVLGYIGDRILDADAFAGLVRESLDEPEVRNYLADEIAAEILEVAPDAAAGGTAIRDLTATLLEADFMQSLIETSARELHRTVLDRDADTMLLFVSDVALTVKAQLSLIDPALADLIPDELTEVAVDMGDGERFVDVARISERVDWFASVAALGAALALGAAIWLDDNRWRGTGNAGLAVALAGGLTLVTISVGGSVLASYTEMLTAGDAIEAAWSLFISDLTPWAWTLILFGGLTCAIAWSLLRFGELTRPIERVRDFLGHRPTTRPLQLLRAGSGLLVAIWLMRDPLSLVALAGVLGGIALGIVSVRELFRVTGLEARLGRVQQSMAAAPVVRTRSAIALAAAGALALVVLAAVATAVLTRDEPVDAAPDDVACNGRVELCPRRLDQVALAATHNSMSASADGFLLANQTRGMIAQLDAGYRGLLIDTWYGRPSDSGPVFTVDPSADEMDEASLEAAERVRERLAGQLGDTGLYLCHGYCEIGAVEAIEALGEIRAWLDVHPREVVVFFVQDMTEPSDTAAMFERSGLAELAYIDDPSTPLPTLDEMIAAGRRVFVMVEEDAGAIPFLHDGFTYAQETPFSFRSESDLSCEPNRGRPDSPLFQVNHFITPALGRNGRINELDVLLPRLEQCRGERGLLPNLVSVDFWESGDTLAAVDALNGVGPTD